MRLGFLITGLVLLLAANIMLLAGYGSAPGPTREGFASYFLNEAAGTKDKYEAIGAYDGVKLSTGNSSSWRYTAPNEPLLPGTKEVELGADNLFIFKNNQCKPECCGASFSCGGGCVCTTKAQRDMINQRGGNRSNESAGEVP
jgi:hypothetical protein